MYAEVLVEYGAKALDRKFTYIVPDKLKTDIQVGMKVIVPFGNSTINGFVVNISDTSETNNLKEIIDIPKQNFILNEELLKLGSFIKETTLCSLISAYQCMLPSSMKVKTIKSNYQKYDEYLVLNSSNEALIFISLKSPILIPFTSFNPTFLAIANVVSTLSPDIILTNTLFFFKYSIVSFDEGLITSSINT